MTAAIYITRKIETEMDIGKFFNEARDMLDKFKTIEVYCNLTYLDDEGNEFTECKTFNGSHGTTYRYILAQRLQHKVFQEKTQCKAVGTIVIAGKNHADM